MKNNKGITLITLIVIMVLIIFAVAVFTVTSRGSSSNKSYIIGQEVTVGGESFYVLEDSDSTQSIVTLLAKYNLNTEGTAQASNAEYGDTAAIFSNITYWESARAAYTDWSTKNLDINTISGETSGDAIYKAKAYAQAKGGTNGRLLTYEEANTLKANFGDMIWGKANKQSNGNYLHYWLSSANQGLMGFIWYVDGNHEKLVDTSFQLRWIIHWGATSNNNK